MRRLAAAVLAVAVVIGTGWGWWRYNDRVSTTADQSADASPIRTAERDPPIVIFVGDSFTGGSDENLGPEWPKLVAAERGWIAINASVGGTGYINGRAVGASVPQQLKSIFSKYAEPDVFVLASGANDLGRSRPDEIIAVVAKTMRMIEDRWPKTRLVLTSSFNNDTVEIETIDLAADLKALAREVGVTFIDVSRTYENQSELIGADGFHPNDAGHQHAADTIGPQLATVVDGTMTGEAIGK